MQLYRRLCAIGATAALLALTGCGGGTTGALKEGEGGLTVVKLISSETFNSALANLLIEGDFAADYGLKFEHVSMAGSGSSNQMAAVLAGDADLASAGSNTAVDAIIGGADIQIVADTGALIQTLVVSQKAVEQFNVDLEAVPEDRTRALKGMTIAVGPDGSAANYSLRTILTEAGLDPNKDVRLVPLADLGGSAAAGLEQGTYDATFGPLGSGEVAVNRGKASVLLSVPAGEAPALDGYVCNVLWASTKFIESNPELIAKIREALAEATRLTQEEPAKAADILKGSVFAEMDQNVFDLVWEDAAKGYGPDNDYTREDWDSFVRIFDTHSSHDYTKVKYEDLVNEVARG